jgi:uncharacterized membrane protein YfcA
MAIEQMILLTGIGLVAGFMSGLFGIAGGAVRIPLLNLVGIPLLSAFAINMFVIPLAQTTGAYAHRKNIDVSLASYVVIGGSIGSVTGAYFAGLVTNLALAMIFVGITILTISGIYRQDRPEVLPGFNPPPAKSCFRCLYPEPSGRIARRERGIAFPTVPEGHGP